MTSRLQAAAVVVLLAFGAWLFWWLRILGPNSLGPHMGNVDLFTQVYPMQERAFALLRAGDLPLWNPHQLAGSPFLASFLYGVLYPLNVFHLFAPAEVALEITTVLHFFLAGLFTYAYARAIGLLRPAALAAAFVFLCSAQLAGLASWFTPIFCAAVWLPFAAFAIERAIHSRDRRWIAALALASAMPLLAGSLQHWIFSAYAMALYAAIRLVALMGERGPGRVALVAGWLLLGAGLGIGLAAVQIIPTAELAFLSPRSPGGLSAAQLRSFDALPPIAVWRQAWFAEQLPLQALFVGPAGATFALLAWLAPGQRARCTALWGLALLSLAIAVGEHTPLAALYRELPGGSWFRVSHRVLFVFAFALAALVGIGVDVLVRFALDLAKRATPPVAGLVLGALVLGLVALIISFAQASQNPLGRPTGGLGVLHREARALEFMRSRQDLYRSLLLRPSPLEFSLMPKQGTLRGLYSITDYEPLNPGRFGDFYALLEPRVDARPGAAAWKRSRIFDGDLRLDARGPNLRLLDLLSVRFVASPRDSPLFSDPPPPWQRVFRSGTHGVDVYENPRPLPRAYALSRATWVRDGATALRELIGADFDPRRRVVIEGAPPAETPGVEVEPIFAAADILHYDAERVTIEADLPQAGFLVLTDTHYPGWQARLDGEPTEILRANYLFRCVALPPGRHRIEFVYAPFSLRAGAITSALSGAVLLLLVLSNGDGLGTRLRRRFRAR